MDTSTTSGLLDAEAISRAEALGLHARYVVEGYMSGEHKSPYRGFAVEFAQHREYTHGDDTRHIDWKVEARTDRLFVKQYEQETNYVANILLDGSESMMYGSGEHTKLQYAKMTAAVLSYLILHQRDAVVLGIFDKDVQDYQPRSNSKATIHNLMSRLASFEGTEETDIAGNLHNMAVQTPRKGIFILISDFFDDEEAVMEGIQHLRFIGHEVIVFHVLDPYELEFPFNGLVEFHGLENLSKVLTRPSEIRQTYQREFDAFQSRIREGCEKNGVHYLLADTSKPLAQVLTNYLTFRLRTSKGKQS
ncbi:MAG TPA: DUF58 domain-containing protein [Verrucomicrobiales bacterium]|nr:DUF58 domain-containing protein [Verrucomicrobiales bacterium]